MTDNLKVRKKVTILGGGVGGVTAAFALTQPELDGQYEVTLYQMGWRLGGKGASGRNPDANQRIEEHGLHIWMGFYYNAFINMKRCYDELGRDPKAPLGSFDTAFKPQAMGTLMDRDGGNWSRWDIPMPGTTDSLTGGDHPSALGYIEMLLQWMARALTSGLWEDVKREGIFRSIWHSVEFLVEGGETVIHDALYAVRDARQGKTTPAEAHRRSLKAAHTVAAALHQSFEKGKAAPLHSRRMAHVFDIACATVVGLFEEGVITRGVPFASLDGRELRQFLLDYGSHPDSMDSPLLRGYYDLAFGFTRGGTGERFENAAAGTALYAILRVCFEYRGAFMWRMEAGMGDTIFGPYYEVLKRRGVKFKFFHRVESLEVAPDASGSGQHITRVRMKRQVDTVGGADYEPLVDVKGLPSWPSVPRYEQLVQGAALRNGPNGEPFNLESRWSGWSDVGDVVLEAGDFDHLVLAIPVGSHPIVCADLMAASPRFKAMVDNVLTVQTFGVQLWMDRAIDAMGWEVPVIDGDPQRAVCDAYADPLNSFADNSHLIPMEQWNLPLVPKTLLYFCGVLSDEYPAGTYPPAGDTAFPARQDERVRQQSIAWLQAETAAILPGACSSGPGLDWDRLVDPLGRAGAARFDAQFWRANIDPNERYVLSVAGSTEYRLKAGDSQFGNLVLAGDWVDTGFSVGCVEAATMGGLQAARAIIGHAQPVFGEHTMETSTTQPAALAAGAILPKYRPGPSSMELVPPYKFNKLEIRSFPVLADPLKLQKLVDHLNIAPPEVCEFRAIGNVAFMQLAVYPYLESEPDPTGWFTENELSFNILVACGKRVDGVFVPDALAYYFPFIYVDNDFAIATGREVFGYPKVGSEMHFGAAGEAEIFSLQTLALPVTGADERARIVKLVEILETERLSGWKKIVAEVEGIVSEFSDLVFGPNGIVADASMGLFDSFANVFGKEQIGIVSLKQFRDAADPTRACYQAVVSTQFKIDTWHQCAPLPGRYAARIAREASMPIIDALGLTVGADGMVTTMQPFVMVYDCTVTVGTNLYVAT